MDLQTALGERHLGALAAGLAVGVVLEEHRDLLAAGRDDLLDDLLGLVVVARAYMEDIAVEGHAQRFGPGKHAHQRNLGLCHHRQMRDAGRRADIAEEREHLVLLDQLPACRRRHRRLVAIVFADELEFAAVYAAGGVHMVEIRLDAVAHLYSELRRRAAEDRGLPKDDLVRRDARVRRCLRRPQSADRHEPGKRVVHRLTSRKAGCCRSAAASSSFQTPPSGSLYCARSHGIGVSTVCGVNCSSTRKPSERCTRSAAPLRKRSCGMSSRDSLLVFSAWPPRNAPKSLTL